MGAASGPVSIPVRSKLKIFLSIDIVGSTEFKNVRGASVDHAHGDHWTRPFLSFYRMSVAGMASHWDTVVEQMKSVQEGNGHFDFGDRPSFWKGAGDEVLFAKTVRSPLDASATIQAMLLLMESHRQHFQSKPRTRSLDVKGAAWLAGFPLNNSEVVLMEDGSPDASSGDDMIDNFKLLALLEGQGGPLAYRADYIGPSVDLGFRLRDHATPRQLVVSADLVWLLCHASTKCSPDQTDRCKFLLLPRISYERNVPLKGVLDGEPYPLFWVESSAATALDTATDALLGRDDLPSRPEHFDLLKGFCEKFLNGAHPLKMTPYIPNCVDGAVSQISGEREERLRKLQAYVDGSAEQIETLGQEDAVTGGIPAASEAFANKVATTPPGEEKKL